MKNENEIKEHWLSLSLSLNGDKIKNQKGKTTKRENAWKFSIEIPQKGNTENVKGKIENLSKTNDTNCMKFV